MYAIKHPDGTWVDNEYHRRHAKTNKMRVFQTPTSARLSLGRVASPLVKAPQRPTGQWTKEERDEQAAYWRFLVEFNKRLSTDEYWELRRKQGYQLIKLQIKET